MISPSPPRTHPHPARQPLPPAGSVGPLPSPSRGHGHPRACAGVGCVWQRGRRRLGGRGVGGRGGRLRRLGGGSARLAGVVAGRRGRLRGGAGSGAAERAGGAGGGAEEFPGACLRIAAPLGARTSLSDWTQTGAQPGSGTAGPAARRPPAALGRRWSPRWAAPRRSAERRRQPPRGLHHRPPPTARPQTLPGRRLHACSARWRGPGGRMRRRGCACVLGRVAKSRCSAPAGGGGRCRWGRRASFGKLSSAAGGAARALSAGGGKR